MNIGPHHLDTLLDHQPWKDYDGARTGFIAYKTPSGLANLMTSVVFTLGNVEDDAATVPVGPFVLHVGYYGPAQVEAALRGLAAPEAVLLLPDHKVSLLPEPTQGGGWNAPYNGRSMATLGWESDVVHWFGTSVGNIMDVAEYWNAVRRLPGASPRSFNSWKDATRWAVPFRAQQEGFGPGWKSLLDIHLPTYVRLKDVSTDGPTGELVVDVEVRHHADQFEVIIRNVSDSRELARVSAAGFSQNQQSGYHRVSVPLGPEPNPVFCDLILDGLLIERKQVAVAPSPIRLNTGTEPTDSGRPVTVGHQPAVGETVSHTRVAVVQFDFHPAALIHRRSPLEDPIFELSKDHDSLMPSSGRVPEAVNEALDQLRARIRAEHGRQVLLKLSAVFERCRAWGVQMVLLPEYSVAPELLPELAAMAEGMLVVAGTHTVERAQVREGLYDQLGWTSRPESGQAVAPILFRGRLLGLQAKLSAAKPEQGSLVPGSEWAPIEWGTVDGPALPGPLGVLICLDFLYRERELHRVTVGEALERARFLAVPSYTPWHSETEFAAHAWEEARRYGRPVLWANVASHGGSSVFVDEGQVTDLHDFPRRVGRLDRGDEGVVVADVDLGLIRPGGSTRHGAETIVKPFAVASLVYRNYPVADRYAVWLADLENVLANGSVDAAADMINASRVVLDEMAALPGGQARSHRIRRLLRELKKVTQIEELRQFTREIVLPGSALPLEWLRKAWADSAAQQVFGWTREHRGVGLEQVEQRLREAGQGVDGAILTESGLAALRMARTAVTVVVENAVPTVEAGEATGERETPVTIPEQSRPKHELNFESKVLTALNRFDYCLRAATPGMRGFIPLDQQRTIDLLVNQLGPELEQLDLVWIDRDGGWANIDTVSRVGQTSVLLVGVYEMNLIQSWVFRGRSGHDRHFILVEFGGLPPAHKDTDASYETEEYAEFEGQTISRTEYDDGFAMIDGKSVELNGRAQLRVRELRRSFWVVCTQWSSTFLQGKGEEFSTNLIQKCESTHAAPNIGWILPEAERLPIHSVSRMHM